MTTTKAGVPLYKRVWEGMDAISVFRPTLVKTLLISAFILSFSRLLAYKIPQVLVGWGDPSPYMAGFGFSLPYIPGNFNAIVWWLFFLICAAGVGFNLRTLIQSGGIISNPTAEKAPLAYFWGFTIALLLLFWTR